MLDRVDKGNSDGNGCGSYQSRVSGYDLDEMSLNSEDTFGTFSSEDG